MHIAKIFFYFIIFNKYLTNKIFEFDSIPSEHVLSSAALTSKPDTPLPKDFILCSSHFQKTINTKNNHGIYVIYQEEELLNPWLSIGIWMENLLWVNVAFKYWYPFGRVPDYFMEKWIHICLKIDVDGKSIEATVNGQTLKTALNVEGLTPTPKFNIQLGIIHDSYHNTTYQFHGQITNIHLIQSEKHNLTSLSKSTCKIENNSNVLHWDDMIWTRTNINETFLDRNKICPFSEYTLLRIPFKWTFEESKIVCSKFGSGQIAGVNNPMEPKNWTLQKQFYDKTKEDECRSFWTPYIYNDQTSNGVKNMYTDEYLDILWEIGHPIKSLMRHQNEVVFFPKKLRFENLISDQDKTCLLCNSSR